MCHQVICKLSTVATYSPFKNTLGIGRWRMKNERFNCCKNGFGGSTHISVIRCAGEEKSDFKGNCLKVRQVKTKNYKLQCNIERTMNISVSYMLIKFFAHIFLYFQIFTLKKHFTSWRTYSTVLTACCCYSAVCTESLKQQETLFNM